MEVIIEAKKRQYRITRDDVDEEEADKRNNDKDDHCLEQALNDVCCHEELHPPL